MDNHIVIIGAGHASGMLAILLRKNKFDGNITIIGDESFFPYQRPELSKGYLLDKIKQNSLSLRKQSFYEERNIEVLLNTSAIKINKKEKNIYLDNGKSIPYKTLVIATGSINNKINISSKSKDIFYLRSISDADKFKKSLKGIKNLGIIGSGYIGLEVASFASQEGINVQIIEHDDRVMSRTASPFISDFFHSKHKDASVVFHFNHTVTDIENIKNFQRIICSNGNYFDVDAVLIAIGVRPNISLAEEAGLKCSNGIIVNDYCLTSDIDIFAIGDCTNHTNQILGKQLRLESVHNAVEQAKTVASYISGNPKAYNQVPWFWSDQCGIKLKIAGILDNFDNYFIKGSIDQEQFTILYIKENKIICSESINDSKNFLIGRKLIEKNIQISLNEISKEDFDLTNII